MARSWKFWNRKTPVEQISQGYRRLYYGKGIAVSEETAMRVSAMYRGVMYVASQMSKLPWNIKDVNNNIIEDKIYYLLNISPNGENIASRFKTSLVVNAILHGNAYAEIERDGAGRPVALWPIPSRCVEPTRDTNGKLWYKVSGMSAVVPGGDVYLQPRNILHFTNLHTKDGFMGLGVVEYAQQVLGIASGADRMAGNLFANGGIPSGLLKIKGTLSEEAMKRLKDSWREDTGGENTGSVAILEDGLEFEALNMDPQMMQMLDSRKFGVPEIGRFLGVPPSKLYDQTAATYSNVEQANLEVVTDTLDAWASNFENEVDFKLLNGQYGGRYSEFDIQAVYRADLKTRAEYFSKRMQMGTITPNEVRRREGDTPVPGGDRLYIATNNYTPMDRVDDVIDAQIAPKETAPTPDPVDPNAEDLTKAMTEYLTRR